MSFHSEDSKKVEKSSYCNNEIDALARWALEESVAGEEPPPEVWHEIRARLEQPKTQFHHRRKRLLSAQLSWLVQILVLGIIVLLAFGFGLSQGFDFSLGHEYVVNGTLTPPPGSEEVVKPSADDALSRYYFFQVARELTILDYRLAP